MFFPPLEESDGETQKLKKFNHHSFFGNPFFHSLSGHCNKFLVLFAQDLIVNCLTALTALSIAIMLFIQMRMAEWGAGMGAVHAKQLILNEMMPKIVRIFGLCWPF